MKLFQILDELRPDYYSFMCGVIFACFLLVGCGTVSPDLPYAHQTAPDHAGVYAHYVDKNSGEIKSQLWPEKDRDTYNALITHYGSDKTKFLTPLSPDAGLTPQGKMWRADQTAITNMINLKMYAHMDKLVIP